MCTWLISASSSTLDMHAQQGLLYLVCVCLSVCLTHIFSDVVIKLTQLWCNMVQTSIRMDFAIDILYCTWSVCILYICVWLSQTTIDTSLKYHYLPWHHTQGKSGMNADFNGVNRFRGDTAHTLYKSAHVRLSTTQVHVKSVVIPCTCTDFNGFTMDLRGLLQRANTVRTVWIRTLLTSSMSVFMAVFPCDTVLMQPQFNDRLNATWNMSQCKRASHFSLSANIVSVYFLYNCSIFSLLHMHFNSVCANFSNSCTCMHYIWAEGLALYCFHLIVWSVQHTGPSISNGSCFASYCT